MINIVICEDEKNEALNTKELAVNTHSDISAVCFENSAECLEYLKKENKGDIFFLDIQLSAEDNFDGIMLAKKIREMNKSAIIIFISAYSEYVFKAFDVEAFNFLVKPINVEKFKEVFCKAVNKIESDKIRNIDYIIVKSNGSNLKIDISDIYFWECCGRKIILHFENSEVKYYGRLSELEKILNSNFFRCHRSYIVNMDKIVRYSKTEAALNNCEKVLISKSKYKDFLREYSRFLRKNNICEFL